MLGRRVGKKKRKKSIREKGGETFTTYGPFFFFYENFRSEDAAAIKRPPYTPHISFSSPFSKCNAHHRRFDQPRRFFVTLPRSLRFSSWFAFHAYTPLVRPVPFFIQENLYTGATSYFTKDSIFSNNPENAIERS